MDNDVGGLNNRATAAIACYVYRCGIISVVDRIVSC